MHVTFDESNVLLENCEDFIDNSIEGEVASRKNDEENEHQI